MHNNLLTDWNTTPPWVWPTFPEPGSPVNQISGWFRDILIGSLGATGNTFRQEVLSVKHKLPSGLEPKMLMLAGYDRIYTDPDPDENPFWTPGEHYNHAARAAKVLQNHLADWGAQSPEEAEHIAQEANTALRDKWKGNTLFWVGAFGFLGCFLASAPWLGYVAAIAVAVSGPIVNSGPNRVVNNARLRLLPIDQRATLIRRMS